MSIVRAFNDHFSEFVNDVKRVFPDNIDIATADTALTTLRKSNPKLILTTFRDHFSKPYGNEIDKGDITFFINKDYGQDLNKFGYGDSNGIIAKIEVMREPISQMNKEDLDKVIKYLQNLKKLSELYV